MPNSHMPPEFLQPCLFSIEEAVLKVYKERPKLEDKDVEMVFEQLQRFFKKLAGGGRAGGAPFYDHPQAGLD